jgi:hypothetical protein
LLDPETAQEISVARALIGALAEALEKSLQEGRSKSLALTHLEDCSMRAVQAIALEYGQRMPFGDESG